MHSTRKITTRRTTAAITLVGLVATLGLSATPALADDVTAPPVPTQNAPEAIAEKSVPLETRLATIKAKGAAAIAQRQASLTSNQSKLATMTTDCGYNAPRRDEMNASSAMLTDLGSQLAVATDVTVARGIYTRIFTDVRIYLVVLPKAGKAMRCDHYVTSIAQFNTSAANLQADIDAAKAKGADTTVSQQLKDAAVASVAGLTPVNSITPCMALLPDKGDKQIQSANAAALASCDASLDSVGATLKSARAQLEQSRAALKGARVADRTADKAAADAKRAADKAAREAKIAADKAAREAAKAGRKAS